MTGNRFEFRVVHNGGIIPRIWDNEKQKYLNLLESCKFLNELHKENQYLKSLKWNQDCINEISIGIEQRLLLEKEIGQLKRRNKKLEKHLRKFYCDEEWKLRELLGDFK